MSLSQKVFKAGVWVSLAFAFSRLLGLVRLTILTRLLVPEDFGLITIVMLVVTSMWVLSDMGTSASVIQRPKLNKVFMHTAWHINWMRGFFLSAFCWLLAPWLALFFSQPELELLLHWAALIPLIQGFESLGMVLLKRELSFKRHTYVNFAKEAVQTVVVILLVLYWKASAEAMLWGLISGTVVASLLSYLLHSYRPSLQFSGASAREIWNFGGHLMGAGILVFAMTNIDDIVIGKMLGVEQLGYYGVAFTLTGILTNQLVQVFNTVMFPALSEIQEDDARVHRILGLSARLMSGVLTPVVCFVAMFPEQLVEFVFGKAWLPAAPVLLVLLCMGWLRGIATVFGPILMAKKQSATLHKMKWMEFGLFSVAIIPAIHMYGIVGAALVLLTVYGLSLILHVLAVNNILSGGMGTIIAQIGYGTIPGIAALGCTVLSYSVFPDQRLLLLGVLFFVTWGLLLLAKERVFLNQLFHMVVK